MNKTIETKVLLTPEFDSLLIKFKGRMSKRQFAASLVEQSLMALKKPKSGGKK
jgi:hypothetical protein